MDEASPMSDISDLSEKMDGMRSEWGKLKDKVSTRGSKVKTASKQATKFHADLETMKLWLKLTEDKLTSAGPVALDKDAISRQLKESQSLQAELLRKSRDHETLNAAGEALVANSEVDHHVVQDALSDVNLRWEELSKGQFPLTY